MTINLGSMNATFSNSLANFDAIGLSITDESSPGTSNLINFTVNNSPKFVIDKFGRTRILTRLPQTSNTKILQIVNDCQDLVIAVPSKVTIKTKTTQTKNVVYSKTYSQGHLYVTASNTGIANIDITKGSVFHLRSPTNTISQIILYTPLNLSNSANVTYSFSLIVKDITIGNNVWNAANVIWSNETGYPPAVTPGNVSIYTFFGMRGFGQFVNNSVWYAFSSDKYLTIDTKQPPRELVLRYSVDSTEVTVDSTLISVDSL